LKFPDGFPLGSSRLRCRCHSSQIRNGQNLPAAHAIPNTPLLQEDIAAHHSLRKPVRAVAIVSIGSNTDVAIDRFGFDDSLIPRLHTLVTTVRSSKWEAKLRGADWGLSFEQAVTLSNALCLDLEVAKLKTQPARHTNIFILSSVAWLLIISIAYMVTSVTVVSES